MRKPGNVKSKDKQKEGNSRENNNGNKNKFKNGFNDINIFLNVLVTSQAYIITISLLYLFRKGTNLTPQVVVSRVLGINLVQIFLAIRHIKIKNNKK